MNTDLELYKKMLTDEKAILIDDLKAVAVKDKRHPDDWSAKPDKMDIQRSDTNEVGDLIESFEENTALVSRLEGRLNNVDLALEKIENDAYGLCEVCNKPIESDRLHANPAARTCKEHLETEVN